MPERPDEERSTKDLERELLDERSMRIAAERRSAQLSENAAIWRRRAEERTERIDRLVQKTPGPLLWLRRRSPSTVDTRATVAEAPSPRPIVVPGARGTRVAALVASPGLRIGLTAMDVRPLIDQGSVDDADIVVIEPTAFLATEDRDGLVAALGSDTRPPVAVWGSDTTLTDTLRATEIDMPPSFDPNLHSPAANWLVDEPPIVANRSSIDHPDQALLQHAAGGGSLVKSDEPLSDPHARSMASAVARRWAYREHAPWVRAQQILAALGLATHEPLPRVAAVLVSNRPALLPDAIRNFSRQTYRPLTLVVGLHGVGDPTMVADLANEHGIEDVQIIALPEEMLLGAALNRCIASTPADVLAKIDDDDHLGPAYIEDAVQALIYSGASIVGKATQFTYVEAKDTTVLRRPGTEERLISGTPAGASLVFRRSTWDTTPLPHRARQVDIHFVQGARLAGAEVYATSRWEFRYFRGATGHTWVASTNALMSGTEPAFSGDNPERTEACGWPIEGDG